MVRTRQQAEVSHWKDAAQIARPSYRRKVKGIQIMNIGAASAASGVSAKMIRHYETTGLLRPAVRRENSYRDYGSHDVHELQFIGRARKLGFSLTEIAALLGLWRDKDRPSRKVKGLAAVHLAELEGRIAELEGMADTLRHLVRSCRGDNRPECPILADLGGEVAEPKSRWQTKDDSHNAAPVLSARKRGMNSGTLRIYRS
jgi:MerR family gold-responsive transcriptional activator of gol and ges genes